VIEYARALELMLASAAPLPARRVPIEAGADTLLAAPVASPQDLPPFDNSAMDGFALASGAREIAAGSEFDVQGRLAAGDGGEQPASGAWEIMTGAPMPPGLDSVVPVEQVEVMRGDDGLPRRIRLRQALRPGQHVRLRGQDVAVGAAVLAAGTRLGINECAVLHALGVAEVAVRVAPRVAVLATGRELLADVRAPLAPGMIHDSNRPYLVERLRAAGAELAWQGVVGDAPSAFDAAIDQALGAGADVVVSTGAVSQGAHDFIPEALRARGAEQVFHKVAIRPGKPVLFARLPGGALYFGLPGNPLSAAAGQRFFVEPVLRRLLGLAEEVPLRLPLHADVDKRAGMRLHALAAVAVDRQLGLGARVLPRQESFRLTAMLQANAWIVADEADARVAAGTPVRVYGWGHLDPVRLDIAGQAADAG